jgi:hypothetical protein
MLLSPRLSGCPCCGFLGAAQDRPGRAAPLRRAMKRRERQAVAREIAAELIAA